MITDEIIEQALTIRAESPRTTFRQVAEQLLGSPDYAVLLRKAIVDKQKSTAVAVATMEKRKLIPSPDDEFLFSTKEGPPPQFYMNLPYAPTVTASKAIIVGDLHCPHVDRGLIEAILDDSLANAVDTIILAGDIIDGQFTGRHKNPAEFTASALEELSYMRSYLKYFEEMFTEVYVLPGNHDGWVLDYFEMSMQELIDTMLGSHDIRVSQYGYVYLNDNIVVGHLEEWNEKPGYLAWKIAKQFNRHAIVNHDHIRGVYNELGSPYIGVSVGAALVPENIYYKRASFNSYPAIQTGYAVLENKNTLRLMKWEDGVASLDTRIHLGAL